MALKNGIGHAIEHFFGDPATPTIPRLEAWALARAARGNEPSNVQWLVTEMPVMEGQVFRLTGDRLPFPSSRGDGRWWVFFVDLDPFAKWGHPSQWVFVPAARWLDPSRNVDSVAVVSDETCPHGAGPVRFRTLDEHGRSV